MSRGYFRMSRGWMRSPDFKTVALDRFCERAAWIWLIEKAAWQSRTYRLGSKVIELERGQLVASLRYLAGEWGWKKDRVARFLKVRQQTRAIRLESATASATASAGTRTGAGG